jgi:1-aminocyclopropane-1-carboxylate deaminase/D-cysteine desulfhydrase-like pyridoxal-dependent ACC family enzyme
MAEQILRLSRAGAAALGLDQPTADDVDVRDCRGDGFGVASAEDRVSSRLALQHEGLMLDDYYGAKAMTLFRTLMARALRHRRCSGTPEEWPPRSPAW